MSFDDILRTHLGTEKRKCSKQALQKFRKWAFGENTTDEHTVIFHMESWNMLHKEELEIKDDGIIQDDLKAMVKLYKERK